MIQRITKPACFFKYVFGLHSSDSHGECSNEDLLHLDNRSVDKGFICLEMNSACSQ